MLLTESIPVALFIDGEYITENGQAKILSPSQYLEVSFWHDWKAKAGPHKVCVIADYSVLSPSGVVVEGDENNNQKCEKISVKGGIWPWER